MNAAVVSTRGRSARPGKWMVNKRLGRAIISLIVFLVVWELGSRLKWPWVGEAPPPTVVMTTWWPLLSDPGYWYSWYQSSRRVMTGFIMAQIIGIPFGLAMATSRLFNDLTFPIFEILRPIPPLAWVPGAIIFWPTQEMSIAFVTFLGAFYVVVINVLGGAKSIDVRYFQSAYSMGASKWDVFRRIILPATLPSIFVGAAVGHGHHVGSGGGCRDDLRRRWGDSVQRRGRSRLLYLELLHRLLVSPDRRRDDQHRHRRLRLELDHSTARDTVHAVAAHALARQERARYFRRSA